ncbi:hypothetical protein PC9H_009434 [Pleurotus ostreatus]|uniref:Glucose-methanol-choline oxidoreductase N-terminal domain-containing protein n=1 Tax=Pleurotus ostreatus TaxID=5322 RepID=A0A8H6ZRC9_PLEOS|nr:uncharacterized protein PC9H_009434 [Pleurotus ostreatus]KAF7424131.1 hypothetical protein PC9H_009434 [Pleurotus ostreatus]
MNVEHLPIGQLRAICCWRKGGALVCVTAGRLILACRLIEAGLHTYGPPEHVQPGRYMASLIPASEVLTFHGSKPSDAPPRRSATVPTGRCVGGGSSVNQPRLGAKEMIPLLKKVETYQEQGTVDRHGYPGPIKVVSSVRDNSLHSFVQWYTKRCSPLHIQPIFGKSKLLTEAVVRRVLMRDGRAIGVEYSDASDPSSTVIAAYARYLVVVSAGALGSPAILERSGIGAAELIAQFGHQARSRSARCRRENYIDLEELGPHFKKVWAARFAAATDKPVVCMVPVSGSVFQFMLQQPSLIFMFATTYPVSTGRVHIASADDWQAGLDFEAGFLTEPADIDALRWAYRRSRETARRMPSYRDELAQAPRLSICPANVGANTYSTALVVREKAALSISQELDFDL